MNEYYFALKISSVNAFWHLEFLRLGSSFFPLKHLFNSTTISYSQQKQKKRPKKIKKAIYTLSLWIFRRLYTLLLKFRIVKFTIPSCENCIISISPLAWNKGLFRYMKLLRISYITSVICSYISLCLILQNNWNILN